MATTDPFSFLYVKLNSKNKNDMFYIRYDKRIEIDE